MAHIFLRPLRRTAQKLLRQPFTAISTPTRNYISEMRKLAFEGNIVRLLRNEVKYEIDRSPPSKPVPVFKSFLVDAKPGEQWIRLNKIYMEKEEIKIDVTMFDGAVPVKKSGGASKDDDDEVCLHLTMTVCIYKGEGDDVLEFVCSAWPDGIEIHKVIMRGHDSFSAQLYTGPPFKQLDDKLQDALYDFLETRGINDELAVFLHHYIMNKGKTEYIVWMAKAISFIEGK